MGLVIIVFGEVLGIVYNNVFMIGNIKWIMLVFGDYFWIKYIFFLCEGIIFVSLFSSFVFGVVFLVYLMIFYYEKIIFGVFIMMSIFYFSMFFVFWQKKVKEKVLFQVLLFVRKQEICYI